MKPNHMAGVYARDYVTDYTSFENDDLMVFAEGNGQLEYEQKHVYAGSERTLQFTDKGNWERTLYVHEDVMGNTRYYTKANGQSFAELTYDAWGMPESPNKLLNNDHGNYVFATFTGHIYDTTLDIYFAEARFYDANNRTWLAVDPVKDGGNWYQYCFSNPTTYYDPTGLWGMVTSTKQALLAGSEIEPALFWRQRDFFNGNWWQNEDDLTIAYEMLLKESQSRNMTIITLAMDYNYFDYFGYANTRVYALQALIGEGRTGVYDPATMTTLRNVLLSQYAEFDFEDPELTPDTLKAIRNWYDNSSEIGKQGTYFWENGWGDIISGGLSLGVAYSLTRPVKVSTPSESSSKPVDIELKHKEGWTPVQKAEAEAKLKALSEAYTVKTPVNRSGTSASSRYKSVYGKASVPIGYDVDHVIDLQLGGADVIVNMEPLDRSVNRSLGAQIQNAIKNYPDGTVFGRFTIH